MARKYELKRRAERQEETRRRIVEAAIALHQTKGPARTSLSEVARLAGVQRHTLYRHFADERALGLACSGDYSEANPAPDPAPWAELRDPFERLRRGLTELYEYFERTEPMLTCVLRDAEVHPLTREMAEMRRAGSMGLIRETLARGVRGKRRLAALDLALSFHTWRTLVRDSGLTNAEAVETIVRAVAAA